MEAGGPNLRATVGAAGGGFGATLWTAGSGSHAPRGHFFPVGVAARPGEEAVDRLSFLDGELPLSTEGTSEGGVQAVRPGLRQPSAKLGGAPKGAELVKGLAPLGVFPFPAVN
eukprot:2030098-Alexandrium_andersonii.AAC.1